MKTPKLELRGVGKSYRRGKKRHDVLLDVDLALGESEFVALVGASGCGKSTLLSIAAGLESFDRGTVLLDGASVEKPGLDVGVVFQSHTLFPWLTARRNVEFALKAAGYDRHDTKHIAEEYLELVGLNAFSDHLPHQLSGGMKQRVAIARALSYRPQVLLMDEPFGALDSLTRVQMQALLMLVWGRQRPSVLFVTHDIDEAIFLADRVVVMAAGPGRIDSVHPVRLSRPRDERTSACGDFLDLRRAVFRSIQRSSAYSRGLNVDERGDPVLPHATGF